MRLQHYKLGNKVDLGLVRVLIWAAKQACYRCSIRLSGTSYASAIGYVCFPCTTKNLHLDGSSHRYRRSGQYILPMDKGQSVNYNHLPSQRIRSSTHRRKCLRPNGRRSFLLEREQSRCGRRYCVVASSRAKRQDVSCIFGSVPSENAHNSQLSSPVTVLTALTIQQSVQHDFER